MRCWTYHRPNGILIKRIIPNTQHGREDGRWFRARRAAAVGIFGNLRRRVVLVVDEPRRVERHDAVVDARL